MKLTNLVVLRRPEADGAVAVKSDLGEQRVIGLIPRIVLDDYFPHRPHLSEAQRYIVAEGNSEIIKAVMERKCASGQWRDEGRYGSTVKIVEIEKLDLIVSRLSDAMLEEQADAKLTR